MSELTDTVFKEFESVPWNDNADREIAEDILLKFDRIELESKSLTCIGCKVYAALQRYHRSQEQCSDCEGCIRIATDRYQKVSK